ncbi:hypothetical protein B0H16DRAFT_1454987 [Mycena metata]|uniref:Uncharacterized protein n=1 Tax=Mycena metata TaxID=1033252 RepID=A0AAD7NJP4_9AGAR|nr:hypothetical protein B0H16DRAFT_1454987 [Mycena metata]
MFRALQILWDISRNFERRRIPWNSCLNPWVKYRRDLRRSMFEEQPKWRQIERKRGQMSRTDLWNFVTASVCVVYQAVGRRDRGQTNGHWLLMGSLRRRLKWVGKCVQVKRVRAREGSIQAWEILQSLPDEGKICTGVEAEFFAACKSTLGKLSATNPDGREFMGHSLLSLEGDIFILAREALSVKAKALKAKRSREASAAYYARHPEIREKKRVQMAKKRAALKANKAAIKADRERKSPKQNAQSAVMRESNDGAPEAADELPPPKLSRLLRYVPPQQAQSAVMRESNDNVPDSADKLPPPDLPLLRYVDLYSDVDSADALPTFQPTPTILEDMNATLTNGRTRSTGLGVARGSGCPSLSVVSSPESAERMAALILTQMANARPGVQSVCPPTAPDLPTGSPRPADDCAPELTYMETMRCLIAQLGSGPMTPPTAAEAARWDFRRAEYGWARPRLLGTQRWLQIAGWVRDVRRWTRDARASPPLDVHI